MAAKSVNGSGNGARSGAQTLLLLATPLNVQVLLALSEEPQRQSDLLRAADSPAQTTLRAQLRRLVEAGAIEKHRRNRFPGVLEYELTAGGRDLLFVLDVLEGWLREAPGGPLALGEAGAKAAIKALAAGWSATIVRALAARPLTLTELDGIIGSLSYPALERRLAALRLVGLVEPRPPTGKGTPNAVTEWLRLGIAPLAAAARWERRHLASATAPVGRLDVEAAFLLVTPLLRLPGGPTGRCRMAADVANGNGSRRRLAGITFEMKRGEIVSCSTRIDADEADAWAEGSAVAWLNAVIDRDPELLELGGDTVLSSTGVAALHEVLFNQRARSANRP